MSYRHTDSQLIEAVQESTSIRQVLAKLGLVEAGGNYSIVKRRIQELHLDTSHFNGKGWRKGTINPIAPAKLLSELLRKGVSLQKG